MELKFNSLKELKDFMALIGWSESEAKPKKGKAPKKTDPVVTEEPAKTEETAATEETTTTQEAEVVVTRDELLKYIQTNLADNVQPLLDMLARLGYQKVSLIPDEQLGEALVLLQGA